MFTYFMTHLKYDNTRAYLCYNIVMSMRLTCVLHASCIYASFYTYLTHAGHG